MTQRLWILVLAIVAVACGGKPAEAPNARPEGAQWQDAFDLVPDVYIVLRPQAIKRDTVYGPLWKSALRVATAKSSTTGAFAAEIADGVDEIVIGIGAKQRGSHDATIVFRGVPARFDAHTMNDASGRPLFVDRKGPPTKVPELERGGSDGDLSLFVLPDRTWVAALGDARGRAREAYAAPFGRPIPTVDDRALVAVRLDAHATLEPRLRRSLAFGPLVKKLSSLTLALLPQKEGLEATFGYEDDDAAAWGEAHAKRLLGELTTADGADPVRLGRLEFVKTAKISRTGRELKARFDVPTRLLEELPHARPEELWRQTTED